MYTSSKKYYLGTGRRKSSVARVRLCEGNGKITVNGRDLEVFFTEQKDQGAVAGPLLITDLRNRVDILINVRGGGTTGQAGAACQGVARAIKTMFGPAPTETPEGSETEAGGIAKKLRNSGYLTRDSRMKEAQEIRPQGRP